MDDVTSTAGKADSICDFSTRKIYEDVKQICKVSK